jgi:GT2 family glycosyltransferase
MDPPLISVIICTLNRSEDLLRALSYFVDREDYNSFEVIIVDQSDEIDSTVKHLVEANADRFRLVQRAEKSLPKSRNAGIELAKGTILVFVDDDVEILPGFLAAYSVAFSEPGVWGSTGPVFNPGASQDLVPASSLAPIELKEIKAGRGGRWDADFAYDINWIVGCNMAIRRDVFEKIGTFNEILEVHCDDAEISHRIKLAGGRLRYTPAPRLIHHQRLTGGTRSDPKRSTEYIRKYVRSGVFFACQLGAYRRGIWRLFRIFILCRRPVGFRQIIGFCQGVVDGRREYARRTGSDARLQR